MLLNEAGVPATFLGSAQTDRSVQERILGGEFTVRLSFPFFDTSF
jgi:hypothetical protein